MTDTKGYIYFAIKTDNESCDLNWFNANLSLQPTSFLKKFEKGQVPNCTIWEYSTLELINPIYSDEIEKLIDILTPHKEDLRDLKLKDPEFHLLLQAVIYLGDETPSLNFSKKVLDFVNYIDAEIDCDIYNSLSSD